MGRLEVKTLISTKLIELFGAGTRAEGEFVFLDETRASRTESCVIFAGTDDKILERPGVQAITSVTIDGQRTAEFVAGSDRLDFKGLLAEDKAKEIALTITYEYRKYREACWHSRPVGFETPDVLCIRVDQNTSALELAAVDVDKWNDAKVAEVETLLLGITIPVVPDIPDIPDIPVVPNIPVL